MNKEKEEKKRLFSVVIAAESLEALLDTVCLGNEYGLYETEIIKLDEIGEQT